MKIVLLESLGISQELLDSYVKPLKEKAMNLLRMNAMMTQPSRLKKRRTPISSSSPTCPLKRKSSMPART